MTALWDKNARILAVVPFSRNVIWLGQALESLLHQSRPPDEITVVDCGAGAESLDDIVGSYDGVTFLRATAVCSPVAAVCRVAATAAFDGYLVQYAEDWAATDRLEQLLATARATNATAVSSSHYSFDVARGEGRVDMLAGGQRPGVVGPRTALFAPSYLPQIAVSAASANPRRNAELAAVRDVLLYARSTHQPGRQASDDRFGLRLLRESSTVPRRLATRRRRTPAPAKPPIFIVGGRAGDAATLAWAIGMHPAIVTVVDTSWLTDLATQAANFAGYPPGARLTGYDASSPMASVRAAFEAAVWATPAFLTAQDPTPAAPTWVAALPPSRRAIAAACATYPDARLIHVTRDIGSLRALEADEREWSEATMAILEVERFFAAERALRLRYEQLVRDPAATLGACLRFLGERPESRCTWPYVAPADLLNLDVVPTGPSSLAEVLSHALLPPGTTTTRTVAELNVVASFISGGESSSSTTVTQTAASKEAAGTSKKKRKPVPIDAAACRRVASHHAPGDSIVCVVSRGDDQLLDLGEALVGWHFPRAADGSYPGYYPASGADAVEHLKSLQAAGASFLLIPPPHGWWLEHYDEFRDHLQQHCRLAATDPAAGWLFDLRGGSTGSPDAVGTPAVDEARDAQAHSSVAAPDPLVTVIVTTYNMEQYIEQSLRSLAGQSYRPLEILVVDDASKDGTLAVLQRLKNEIPNLRVLSQRRNAGTYVARNLGIRGARGSLITFNDADDISHPDRIRRQVDLWRRRAVNPDETMVVCDYQRISESGETILNRGLVQRLSMQSPLIPKAVFDEMGVFDSVRMSADAELIDRFRIRFSASNILHVKAALYFAKVRGGSLTAAVGAESSLGTSEADAERPVQEFLSEPRRQYLASYQAWHRDRGTDVRMEFPLRARPFYTPDQHARDVPSPARVVAGMATHLGRRSTVEHAVQSIAAQVDMLFLHLNDYDEPPPGVCLPNVKITTYAEHGDLNDAGKFLMLPQVNGDSYIFAVDDDIVYPSNYVEHLLAALEQFGRSVAVGVHGVVLAWPLERFFEGRSVAHFRRPAVHRRFVDIVGTGTVAFHSSAVNLSLADFQEPGMADLWFAAACKEQGVPRIMVERPDRWLGPLDAEDSLWSAFGMNDSIQTRVALDRGPWGRESLSRELAAWGGEGADDPFFWERFGFGSTTFPVLEHRTS